MDGTCEIVTGIQQQQARHKKQAAARRKLDKATERAEREAQRALDLRAEFDAIHDLASLMEFGEFYVMVRHKNPILDRGDDDIFVRYLKLAQDYAPQMFEALKSGNLTVNQVVTCLLPLAEIRTRKLLGGLPKQDAADTEDAANQALFFAVAEALTKEVTSFAGFLVVRIDGDVKDFKKKEFNARRFVDDEGYECKVECASVLGIEFERRVDRRTSSAIAEVDAMDELHGIAKDDTDLTILEMRVAGYKDGEIGEAVGLTKSAVNHRRRVMESRHDERLLATAEDDTDERIIKLRLEGVTDKAIAATLNIGVATVQARMSGMERKFSRKEQIAEPVTVA